MTTEALSNTYAAQSSISFTTDRFGNPYSAIALNAVGFVQVPAGVYFSGDLTIMVWVKINSIQYQGPRVIDFGNGVTSDNILLTAHFQPSSNLPLFQTCDSGATCKYALGTAALSTGVWIHLTATLSGTTGTLYMNGSFWGSQTGMPVPRNVTRNNCYIGKSGNYPVDPLADIVFDELKIFNVALNQSQVQAHYNENPTYISIIN
jgi:hypothetical protein